MNIYIHISMSRVNVNFLVYNNTLEWMKAMGMKIGTDQILNEKTFMDEMITRQYIFMKTTTKNNTPAIVVVVSETNMFSKKKDVEHIFGQLPMDGKTEVTIVAKSIWPTLLKYPFIRNVVHDWLLIDPRSHINSATCSVVDDIEQVKWDMFVTNESELKNGGRMKYDDPMVFWIGAKKGDHVLCVYPAEDAVSYCEYRIVI
jgi:hypothetical protein